MKGGGINLLFSNFFYKYVTKVSKLFIIIFLFFLNIVTTHYLYLLIFLFIFLFLIKLYKIINYNNMYKIIAIKEIYYIKLYLYYIFILLQTLSLIKNYSLFLYNSIIYNYLVTINILYFLRNLYYHYWNPIFQKYSYYGYTKFISYNINFIYLFFKNKFKK